MVVWHRYGVLDPTVKLNAAVVGSSFVLMGINVRPHRAAIIDDFLQRNSHSQKFRILQTFHIKLKLSDATAHEGQRPLCPSQYT
ncbi:hypothetical protein TNCV_2971301 [Trichonephila clavipes]|nr:hypothetical protein TNCV_2971301 [Trichonephila clavipes]